MGRGKVQLKRIEDKISRQVTFCKRRSGLQKKAHEISVLCDADVALIIFSTKGKLFEYSSDFGMERIIDRYERHVYSNNNVNTDSQSMENWSLEYPRLKSRFQLLQRNLRNYQGQDLDPLGLRELQNLEQQIDTSLRRIRTKKNQLMHEAICELQKKERALQDQNNSLANQLKEKEKWRIEKGKQLGHEALPQDLSTFRFPQPPLELHVPALTIGFCSGGSQYQEWNRYEEEGSQARPTDSGIHIPPWLLGHLNRQ